MTSADAAALATASVTASCPICGARQRDAGEARDYITGERFPVRRCDGCGFGQTVGLPASLDRFYPRRYRRYAGLTLAALRWLYAVKVRSWSRRLGRPGRALELGCGDGWMLAALRGTGWRVLGNERSLDGARAARDTNAIQTFVGGLDALRAGPRFTLVVLFQVLEHLLDPLPTLRHASALLAPGGTMVVAVPNSASWQARLFGRSWFHLDVPRHVNHFSPESLRRAYAQAGLRVVRVRFVSVEHDPYGWIQSALNALGFPQNLLTKWLMGMDDAAATPLRLAAMVVISAVLVVPAVAIALLSWAAGRGALVEVWGVKT